VLNHARTLKALSGSLQTQYGQRQIMCAHRLGQQVTGHVQAGTAGGTAAGAHGQLGHRRAAITRSSADLVIGYSVADANVHSGL